MWKNQNVWILMSGSFISLLGLWIGTIGNLEFMQNHVESDFLKALLLIGGVLAAVLFGPLAGKLTDRNLKKNVLLITGFLRIVSVAFMFLAIYYQSIIWMAVFLIVIHILATFSAPASQAINPLIVKSEHLLSLNSLSINIATIARILGAALGGIMVLTMSLYMIYLVSMIAYIIIFICTLLLKVEETVNVSPSNHLRGKSTSFRSVIPIVKGLPIVGMVIFLTLIPGLFLGGFNLIIINISEIQNDAGIKGLLYTVEGICVMIGAFFIKRISRGRNVVSLLVGMTFIVGISQILLFFSDIQFITLLAFGLFGLCSGAIFPMAFTLFQKQVPKESHGRFFSLYGMIDRVFFLCVLLLTGLLLDLIGLQNMVILSGSLSLFVAFYFAVKQVKTPITYIEAQASQ